jgi:protein-tyrosine phosphatase
MEKKSKNDEEEKEETEEKEIMFVMDNLEKCNLCGKDGAYIKEEGIYICNDCFVEQKREIFNLYMNKVNLYPSYEQITNKIYLGNEDTARDKEILNKLNISNILICAEGCEPFFPNEFKYKILYIDDAIDENILSWLEEAFEFIDSSINNIYIHCAMGISRSPTIVISYLMYKKKMKYEEAYDFVKEKRKVISPNSGFQEQLKKFETILEENNYILPDNLGENNNDNDNKNSKEIQNK